MLCIVKPVLCHVCSKLLFTFFLPWLQSLRRNSPSKESLTSLFCLLPNQSFTHTNRMKSRVISWFLCFQFFHKHLLSCLGHLWKFAEKWPKIQFINKDNYIFCPLITTLFNNGKIKALRNNLIILIFIFQESVNNH